MNSVTSVKTFSKAYLVSAMETFANRRPMIERRDYPSLTAYWRAQRKAARHKHDARALLRYIERHPEITVDHLVNGNSAAGLPLSMVDGVVDHSPAIGQRFGEVFRGAVCRAAAAAIWEKAYSENSRAAFKESVLEALAKDLGQGLVSRHFSEL
jgi:hypothetical protein